LTPWYLNDNLALTLAKEDKDEQFRGEASAAAGGLLEKAGKLQSKRQRRLGEKIVSSRNIGSG